LISSIDRITNKGDERTDNNNDIRETTFSHTQVEKENEKAGKQHQVIVQRNVGLFLDPLVDSYALQKSQYSTVHSGSDGFVEILNDLPVSNSNFLYRVHRIHGVFSQYRGFDRNKWVIFRIHVPIQSSASLTSFSFES
jgi:hypothetical protein